MGANQRVARPKAGWVRHSEVHGWIGAPIQGLISWTVHQPSNDQAAGRRGLQAAQGGL